MVLPNSKNRSTPGLLCLLFLLLASAPNVGWAQVGRMYVSAEAYVGLARVVHVGKIVELKPIEYKQRLTSTQESGKPFRLVFEVSETIRGDGVKRLELVLSLQDTEYLDYMREQSVAIMLVGGPTLLDTHPVAEVGIEEQGKRLDGQWYQFRLLDPLKIPKSGNGAEIASQLNQNYDSCRMFTNELKIVEGRDAILKRARAFAGENNKMLTAVTLIVPNEFGALCGASGAYSAILLPKCPSTQKTLTALKNDPGLILRPIKSQVEKNNQSRLRMEAEERRKSVLDESEKTLAEFPNVDGK